MTITLERKHKGTYPFEASHTSSGSILCIMSELKSDLSVESVSSSALLKAKIYLTREGPQVLPSDFNETYVDLLGQVYLSQV